MKNTSIKPKLSVSKTLTKMMLYNFIVGLIAISCMSVIIYNMFSKAAIQDIQGNIRQNLEQDVSELDLIRNQVFALGLQLINDSDVIDGVYGNKSDDLTQYRITQKLMQVKDSNTMLDSIYIYNGRTRQFASSNGSSGSEALDRLMAGVVASHGGVKFLPLTYSYTNLRGEAVAGDIVTFVFNRSTPTSTDAESETGSPLDGAVIINVNAQYLQKCLTAVGQTGSSGFYLINGSGDVICDTGLETFAKNMSGDAVFHGILSSGNSEGYQVEKDEGRSYLFTYVRSDTLPFLFINKSDYGMLLEKVYALRTTIIGLCLAVLAVCLVLSVLAAYNVYLPFDKLVKRISFQLAPESRERGGKRIYSDIDYLSSAFSSIIKKSDELELSIHESIPFIRKSFLKALLEGGQEALAGADQKIRALGLNISGQARVLLFSVDGYGKLKPESLLAMTHMKEDIEKLIFACLSADALMETVDIQEDAVAVILCINEDGPADEAIQGLLASIQKELWEKTGISVSAAAGEWVERADQLHQSYANCLDLIKYRFVLGYRSLLQKSVVMAHENKGFTPVEKNKKQIIQAIRSCDVALLEKEIAEFAGLLAGSQYDYIRLELNQLALDILVTEDSLLRSDGLGVDFNNIHGNLNNMDTLEESRDWLISHCKCIIQKLEGRKENRKRDMIDMVLVHINQNYQSPELSSEMLSEIANLTPGYFGKIFSEFTGMTVNEYIMELRMKKARELLENKNASVNDIAAMVGFQNQSYFSAIFKRNYGVTPNQYRTEFKSGSRG